MRKHDSMFRDDRLNQWHADQGLDFPVTGMPFLTIEYDRGVPVGMVNYIRRDMQLPHGPDIGLAYKAVASMKDPDGEPLPFLTARYDNHNWSYQLYAHNQEAADLLHRVSPSGVAEGTEEEFARVLYAMRGRTLPDLSRWGIEFARTPWHQPFETEQVAEVWHGSSVSARRRAFEPEGPSPMRTRVPCTDIDLTVVNRSGTVALVVDYKLGDARVDPKSASLAAQASLEDGDSADIPALVVRYIPGADTCPPETECDQNHEWMFSVHALNASAVGLAAGLGIPGLDGGNVWLGLTGAEWADVLKTLRG